MQISPINSTNQNFRKTDNLKQTSFKMNIPQSLKHMVDNQITLYTVESRYIQNCGHKIPKREDYFNKLRNQLPTMEEFKNMVNTLIKRDTHEQWIKLYKKAPCRTLAFFNMKDSSGKFYRDCTTPNINDDHFNMPDLVEAMTNATNSDGKKRFDSFSNIIDYLEY